MKNRFSTALALAFFLSIACLVSCKKDTDGAPDSKAGNPVMAAITPGEASGGTVITLTGSGLGAMRSIVFQTANASVPATFQSNLNTESSLLFRVPDTAFGGPQNIIFTNSEGKQLTVPFKVVALPTVTSITPIEFAQDTIVTVIGNNLDGVTNVTIEGTTSTATVISSARKKLVLKMPATTVNRAKLNITNASGSRVSDIELTYLPNALQLFMEGFGTGVQDWSWANTHDVSTNAAIMGSQSLRAVFGGGSYGAVSLRYDTNIPFSQYTYLTFWAKGGSADMQLSIWPDMPSGAPTQTVTIPANVWTYFKVPLNYIGAAASQRLNLQGMAPATDQTIYFDNVLLVK
ncbi:MAG: cell shape determination protein CcmA [Chitinophagaceae bacterium]|nr:MAG: cell shape determination protein CcmA [Chitinophagaceae bacterium]